MDKVFTVYILASKRNGALYIDMTDDLPNSVLDHKCNMVPGITRHYAIHQLVYFEHWQSLKQAMDRVAAINQLHRIWKLDLIEGFNPQWLDLYSVIAFESVSETTDELPV